MQNAFAPGVTSGPGVQTLFAISEPTPSKGRTGYLLAGCAVCPELYFVEWSGVPEYLHWARGCPFTIACSQTGTVDPATSPDTVGARLPQVTAVLQKMAACWPLRRQDTGPVTFC